MDDRCIRRLGYKIIKCAPIITDRKALELLGSREDLFAKTNEEILNVNA